jgi:hypothetical protein
LSACFFSFFLSQFVMSMVMTMGDKIILWQQKWPLQLDGMFESFPSAWYFMKSIPLNSNLWHQFLRNHHCIIDPFYGKKKKLCDWLSPAGSKSAEFIVCMFDFGTKSRKGNRIGLYRGIPSSSHFLILHIIYSK